MYNNGFVAVKCTNEFVEIMPNENVVPKQVYNKPVLF